ncbi:hypothetical protein Tcan_01268, partial [Toxocara canis]
LHAFLGLINSHKTFVKDLCSLRTPLDVLTKKFAVYTWAAECQSCSDSIKETVASDLLLPHFNPKLPINVSADASNREIGAVLQTDPKRRYTIPHKDFNLVFFSTLRFFFVFFWNRGYVIILLFFGKKKRLPIFSVNRLQRWTTTLLNYDFTIEEVNTKDFGQVDALSRLIASQPSEPKDCVIAAIDTEVTVEFVDSCSSLPVSFESLQTATTTDRVVKQVVESRRWDSWPKI